MQMLKKLGPGWEPRPPWKRRCSACITRGRHAEVCLEIRWRQRGKFGQGFIYFCQSCGPSNHSHSGRASGAVD